MGFALPAALLLTLLGTPALEPSGFTILAPVQYATEPREPEPIDRSHYPSDKEIEASLEQMHQRIPQLVERGYYQDRRSPKERQERADFAAAWAKVDGAIAPFLGNWSALEESLYIYPAPNRGEVCIIYAGLEERDFYLGQVVDGKIYAKTNSVYVLDNGFLVDIYSREGETSVYQYSHPRPLADPEHSPRLLANYPNYLAQFQDAGCAVGLP